MGLLFFRTPARMRIRHFSQLVDPLDKIGGRFDRPNRLIAQHHPNGIGRGLDETVIDGMNGFGCICLQGNPGTFCCRSEESQPKIRQTIGILTNFFNMQCPLNYLLLFNVLGF